MSLQSSNSKRMIRFSFVVIGGYLHYNATACKNSQSVEKFVICDVNDVLRKERTDSLDSSLKIVRLVTLRVPDDLSVIRFNTKTTRTVVQKLNPPCDLCRKSVQLITSRRKIFFLSDFQHFQARIFFRIELIHFFTCRTETPNPKHCPRDRKEINISFQFFEHKDSSNFSVACGVE